MDLLNQDLFTINDVESGNGNILDATALQVENTLYSCIVTQNLLYALGSRMKISRQIGEYKKDNNIAIIQASRWDSLFGKVIEKGREYGLSEKFLNDVFNAIHEASVEVQNEIISGKSTK